MSDRLHLPRPAPEVSEDGVSSIEEIPKDVLLTGDPLEGDLPPLDRPPPGMNYDPDPGYVADPEDNAR